MISIMLATALNGAYLLPSEKYIGETDFTVSALKVEETKNSERNLVLEKIYQAQKNIKSGKFEGFKISLSSIVSYKESKVSPRSAFLGISPKGIIKVDRVFNKNSPGKHYRIKYSENIRNNTSWDIDVIMNTNSQIEKVDISFMPPAPF